MLWLSTGEVVDVVNVANWSAGRTNVVRQCTE